MHETNIQSNVMSPLYGILVCVLAFGRICTGRKRGSKAPTAMIREPAHDF